MKKFQFRLETLKRVRERKVDLHSIEVDSRRNLRNQEKERLAKIEEHEKESFEQRRLALQQSSADEMFAWEVYTTHVSYQRQQQEDKLYDAEENLKISTKKLVKSLQEKQVVSKYRERKFSEYNNELVHDEQKELDEVANNLMVNKTNVKDA